MKREHAFKTNHGLFQAVQDIEKSTAWETVDLKERIAALETIETLLLAVPRTTILHIQWRKVDGVLDLIERIIRVSGKLEYITLKLNRSRSYVTYLIQKMQEGRA